LADCRRVLAWCGRGIVAAALERRTMRRKVLTAAAPACLLLGLTPVAASADVVVTPAPPSNATATAAQVTSLVAISTTGASADQTKADAKAAVLSIGGSPILGTGGSQASEGDTGGAILDTGNSLPAHIEVAPWKASAHGTKASGKRSSSASAALARVEVPNVVKAGVLTSDAAAEHRSDQSTGTSTSDAADISLLDTLRLVLLHSEVTSTAKGNTYLIGLNGTEIGTQEQLGKLCSLDASIISLSCLTASGGTANGITTGTAEVAGVSTALGVINPVGAFTTAASTGPGTSILDSVAAAVPVAETPRAAAAAPAPAATLPRTGVALASLAASAFAALLMGFAQRLLGRRRVLA
jgi:hypothetical protein